jgi:hypothetical protein
MEESTQRCAKEMLKRIIAVILQKQQQVEKTYIMMRLEIFKLHLILLR